MSEIKRELETIKQITGNRSTRDTPETANTFVITNEENIESAEPIENFSNNLNKKVLSKNIPETDRTSKSARKSEWKKELTEKINRLEKELEELRLEHTKELKEARRIPKFDSNLFLDIVSSNQSSPAKKDGTFRVNPTKTYNHREKGDVENDGAEGSGTNAEVRKKLEQAKKVMDRGFKTARELNEFMEFMKRKSKLKKDASLQVSVSLKTSLLSPFI